MSPQDITKMTLRKPQFDDSFREQFEELLRWRRDVRSFLSDPIDGQLLEHLIGLASLAPSVGYSQPWRFVLVESPECRESIRANFEHCNREALNSYSGEKAQLYASLKLAGLRDAPVHLAIFLTENTHRGSRLGRITMPETLEYSAVLAVYSLWLAACTYGLGLGWVSILDPSRMNDILDVPHAWQFIGYFCLGYPRLESDQPELERLGWERRQGKNACIVRR